MTTGPQDPGRRARATLVLGLVCTLLFLWTWSGSGWPVLEQGGRIDPLLLREAGALDWLRVREDGAWWRLFSAVLLHGSWWHLTFNLWALFVLGSSVERRFGLLRWAIVVALSAAGSGLAALAWGRANMVVGISGVVFGLGGFLVALDVRAALARWLDRRKPSTQSSFSRVSDLAESAPQMSTKELAFWLSATLGVGFVWPELSQAGHVGGLVVGVLLGGGGGSLIGSLLVVGSLLAGGALAVHVSLAEPTSPDGWERLGYALLDAERPSSAWPCFDQAVRLASEGDQRVAEWQNASAYARAIGSEDEEEWRRGLVLVGESLGADPENANRLDTQGLLLCQLGAFEDGRRTLERAAELMGEEVSAEVTEHIAACSIR